MGTVLKGISDICGINFDIASGNYRCIFTEGRTDIEGIKSVASFSNDCLLLNLKNKKMEVRGNNLFISELSKGFIRISGTVSEIKLL